MDLYFIRDIQWKIIEVMSSVALLVIFLQYSYQMEWLMLVNAQIKILAVILLFIKLIVFCEIKVESHTKD